MSYFYFIMQALNFILLICNTSYSFSFFALNLFTSTVLYANYLIVSSEFESLSNKLDFIVKMDMKETLEEILEEIRGK